MLVLAIGRILAVMLVIALILVVAVMLVLAIGHILAVTLVITLGLVLAVMLVLALGRVLVVMLVIAFGLVLAFVLGSARSRTSARSCFKDVQLMLEFYHYMTVRSCSRMGVVSLSVLFRGYATLFHSVVINGVRMEESSKEECLGEWLLNCYGIREVSSLPFHECKNDRSYIFIQSGQSE
ncbi:hypothetical protein LR48_Vigan05g135300 [Vigna angularis]|uniref:Uncharacterized protein n=1 Tax=Phaseolus angularis TaxID=3914 RepID=A0A0L9ULX2_PHAAN|nr:hypothetical protein LR48_Vigan05g135300 [Vigna angularis]